MTKTLALFVSLGIISLGMSPLVHATQEDSEQTREENSFSCGREFTYLLTKAHDGLKYYSLEGKAEEQISLLRQEIGALEHRIQDYDTQMGACKEVGKMNFLVGLAYNTLVNVHFMKLEHLNSLTESEAKKKKAHENLRLGSFKSAKIFFELSNNAENDAQKEKKYTESLWHAHILKHLDRLEPKREYVEELYKIVSNLYEKSPSFCHDMGDLWTYLSYSSTGGEFEGQYDVANSFHPIPQTMFTRNVLVTIKNHLDENYPQ